MERYRIYSDGALYFVTFTVVEWLPVFVTEDACRIVTDSLDFCRRNKGLRINAYVIMPTHLHAIVFHKDFESAALERCLTDLRKFTGRKLSDFCAKQMPVCFSEVLREKSGKDRERRFWQPGKHPEQIETEAFWQEKFNYLHENPCRKGLVVRAQYWRFSSAAYWLSDGEVRSEVALSAVEW
jgi:REP element-mobilizing transposase RayT